MPLKVTEFQKYKSDPFTAQSGAGTVYKDSCVQVRLALKIVIYGVSYTASLYSIERLYKKTTEDGSGNKSCKRSNTVIIWFMLKQAMAL